MPEHNVHTLLEELNNLPFTWAFTACNDKKAAIYQDWRNVPLSTQDFEDAIATGYFERCEVKRKKPKEGQDPTFKLPADWVVSVGCMCGEPSGGLLFLDHDGPSVDIWLKQEMGMTPQEAFPKSATVTSGRKGRYTIVYQIDPVTWPEIATTKIRTGEKGTETEDEMIEFRWTGLQSHVLGHHPMTGRYTWVHHPKNVPIAEAPEWMIAKMKEAGDRRKLYEESSGELRSKSRIESSFVVVKLEDCLAKVTRRALEGDFREGRNDTGSKIIARDLIGTANYLNQIGQPFEGDPEKMFMDWCQTVGLFDDDPPNQPQTMWQNALKSNPTPSLTPEMIEGCVKGVQVRERKEFQASTIDKVVRKAKISRAKEMTEVNIKALGDIETVKPESDEYGPGSLEESIEVKPEEVELTEDDVFREVVQAYRQEKDAVEKLFMGNEIKLRYKISDRQLDKVAERLVVREEMVMEPLSEIAGTVTAEMFARMESSKKNGIPSGFTDIDKITGGFHRGELIILAARPSMGKTCFCMDIALNIMKEQAGSAAFYSLEMSKEQLTSRAISAYKSIPGKFMREASISNQQYIEVSRCTEEFKPWPFYLGDRSALTPSDIRVSLEKLVKKTGNIDIVFIDYLQLMDIEDSRGGFNRNVELGKITRELKQIAKDFNCAVMALSQLSRGVESRTDKRPMMSDLRESGAIEQDADLILLLYRDEYYNPDTYDRGLAEVIFAKNRNGEIGTVKILFENTYPRFMNLHVQGSYL